MLLGLMVAGLPWMLGGATEAGQINDLIVGLLVAVLAIPRGPKQEQYNLWKPILPEGTMEKRTIW